MMIQEGHTKDAGTVHALEWDLKEFNY